MADYIYPRELAGGRYNINNINHTEGTGTPVLLEDEIIAEPTLPDVFQIKNNGPVCTVTIADLTGAQKNTLDGLVVDQKTDN